MFHKGVTGPLRILVALYIIYMVILVLTSSFYPSFEFGLLRVSYIGTALEGYFAILLGQLLLIKNLNGATVFRRAA